ncbi:MAG TPA: ECF transporter S component [Clostridia bacterium]|nr:ECF transporter S component [Clostridia bacterium]
MNTSKLVRAALMTAIVLALTLIVLPLPMSQGYINLGDAGVYAAVAAVGGIWGVAAAALGSALADVILAYTLYAPATLVIKGIAALFALLVLRRLKGAWRLLGLLGCGVFIAGGYLVFEGLFVSGSFAAALVNLPFNLVQAAVGAALGYALISFMEKLHLDS